MLSLLIENFLLSRRIQSINEQERRYDYTSLSFSEIYKKTTLYKICVVWNTCAESARRNDEQIIGI